MRKPYALAVLAYLVPTFFTGFVWHLVVFHDVYSRLNIYRADPIIPFGFGSMLVQGLIFAWAYPRLSDTGRSAWVGSALQSGLQVELAASVEADAFGLVFHQPFRELLNRQSSSRPRCTSQSSADAGSSNSVRIGAAAGAGRR